jgi:hypothetical protein
MRRFLILVLVLGLADLVGGSVTARATVVKLEMTKEQLKSFCAEKGGQLQR